MHPKMQNNVSLKKKHQFAIVCQWIIEEQIRLTKNKMVVLNQDVNYDKKNKPSTQQ